MIRIIFVFGILFSLACTETEPATELTEVSSKEKEVSKPIIKRPVIDSLDYNPREWRELLDEDSTIVLDIRYATTNNFVSEVLYNCGRCFLRPEAAKAVAAANKKLKTKGYRLKMFDCFRPLPVQQRLWDKFQNASYVTPPAKGSMHNRGLAVDLTIVDETGKELDMGTEFDFFGKEAHHTYTGHSVAVNKNRKLLKSTLESVGFKGIRTEWWHYSLQGVRYELSDMVWKCY